MPTSVQLPVVTAENLLLGLILLSPVLVVIVTGIVVLLIDLLIAEWLSRRPLMWIATLGLLVGIATCGLLWLGGYVGKTAFGGFLVLDGFALFFQMLFLLAAVLVILSATTFADREELVEAEFYVMTLFSTSGLMLMSAGSTAVLLYGMALLYGVTGATKLDDIARLLQSPAQPATLLAVTMLVA